MALSSTSAVLKTLTLCTVLGFSLPSNSLAQSGDTGYDKDEPVMEEVLVTGTRIKRVDLEGPAPVTIIDRELIDMSGYTTVSQLLGASVYNTEGVPVPSAGDSGYGGAAFVNLRGMGAESTLVLLNGRRLAPFPGGGAESQDINQIPIDAVERVEILRDGASAIYGSDAIAGVVNIITRKNMQGAVVMLQLEDRDVKGGEAGRASVTGGYSWDRGNLTFSLEHFREKMIYQRDIPRMSDPMAFGVFTYSGYPASALVLDGPLQNLLLTDPRCPSDLGESEAFPKAYRWNWYEREPGSDWLFEASCGYNYAVDSSFSPEYKRNSLLLDGHQELGGQTRLVARVLYTDSEADEVWAPAALEDDYLIYGADNPVNPLWLYIGRTVTDPGLLAFGIPDGTWEFSEDDLADVWVTMRTVPSGNRTFTSDHENTSIYAGLEGAQAWLGGTQWELGLEWARSHVRDTSRNLTNLKALQELMDSGALDLFNVQGLDHDTWMANSTAAFAAANHTSLYFGDTDMWTVDGMLSFDGFQWDSGPVPVVLGFEYRDLDYSQGTDPLTQAGYVGWYTAPLIESAGRQVTTAYAEALLPLGSQVELNLALRYDHYSDFGSTTNPKVSLAWRPGQAWLLRGTWGTGFKAPNMIELFAPRTRGTADAVDYVGCANGVAPCQRWQYFFYSGGNPDLEPHDSKSWTAGVVWNATDQLALELTYYSIEYTNEIREMSVQDMFWRERDGLSHTVVRKADGTVDYVDSTLINLSALKNTGIDFNASYTLNTERSGLFDFSLALTHRLSGKWRWQENDPYYHYIDTVGVPETRANFVASWTYKAFQVTWVSHYIDEHGKGENHCWPGWTEGPCGEGSELFHFDKYWWHDLQLAWTAPWNGQFTLGARNLFNEEPPYHDCCANTVYQLYDPTGRAIYLRYRQEF